MLGMPRPLLALLALTAAGCMHVSPAAKSPLKEKLAPLSEEQLRELSGACFEKLGWKMDPYPTPFGDTERVRATKGTSEAALYLYPPGIVPRITGDMAEGGDTFWKCLEGATR